MGDRKIWAFLGDGECDEPESLGSIALAGREQLDNLVFVINCNLQRLDGPVRGNGKIIQELEGVFRGAGWNVIKVVWGRHWDPLFDADEHDKLIQRMNAAVDGEYQNYKARGGSYTREHFFGVDPELLKMVEHLSDDDIMRLNRGGHDPFKLYAAYHAAVRHTGQPSVILAKTVKGYGMGESGESENTAHQTKKLGIEDLKIFRDRFDIPLTDDQLADTPYFGPPEDSPEMQYMKARRAALGGPAGATDAECIAPGAGAFRLRQRAQGFRRTRDLHHHGVRAHPVHAAARQEDRRTDRADRARRGADLRHGRDVPSARHLLVGGQLYEPEDSGEIAPYKESKDGQVLEEGINEAGAMSAWIAAATSYSNHDAPVIPFYIYYSMFGFQRVGDLAWLAGDIQARGFLLGGTAGRTTLNGEGLQHQDGHSHLIAATIPNCVTYDPTYAYELAVIIQDGMRRMYVEQEDVFYYVTVMNENYAQPAMPEGVEGGILRGMYRLQEGGEARDGRRVRLLGSGTILREVEAAANLLRTEFGVEAEVFSVTSFNELRRDCLAVDRWNLLHPEEAPRTSWVESLLGDSDVPVVAATDHMKAFADQIRQWVPAPYRVLGTDGFGRSDTREMLRGFFEVDRRFVTVAALKVLADAQVLSAKEVADAIAALGIDPEKPDPVTV